MEKVKYTDKNRDYLKSALENYAPKLKEVVEKKALEVLKSNESS